MVLTPRFARCLAAVALALTTSGCSILEPRPDLTRFYVLTTLAEPAGELDSNIRVGIGPLLLPDYLQRYEMAHRNSATELRYADTERWAEPLLDSVGRTLAENVALLVGTKRVMVLPAPIRGEPDVTVPIEIIRFEPMPDGRINLVARWIVRTGDAADGELPQVQLSQFHETPQDDSWSSRSEAMSRAVLALSREISEAIRATVTAR